jgi:hypothetical protein
MRKIMTRSKRTSHEMLTATPTFVGVIQTVARKAHPISSEKAPIKHPAGKLWETTSCFFGSYLKIGKIQGEKNTGL